MPATSWKVLDRCGFWNPSGVEFQWQYRWYIWPCLISVGCIRDLVNRHNLPLTRDAAKEYGRWVKIVIGSDCLVSPGGGDERMTGATTSFILIFLINAWTSPESRVTITMFPQDLNIATLAPPLDVNSKWLCNFLCVRMRVQECMYSKITCGWETLGIFR